MRAIVPYIFSLYYKSLWDALWEVIHSSTKKCQLGRLLFVKLRISGSKRKLSRDALKVKLNSATLFPPDSIGARRRDDGAGRSGEHSSSVLCSDLSI